MKYLIVNADDFGLTRGVCEGILKAHRQGIVTSASLLMNSPVLESYREALRTVPQLDLGIHLNITWGKPVSDPSTVSSLLNEQGRFNKSANLAMENVKMEEVEREWKAQIQKARTLKIPLSHLDTHHHTHMHPALLDLLAGIAEDRKLAVRSQTAWIRDFLSARSIPTPGFYVGDFYGEGKISREHLETLLETVPDGYTELCCHPGIADEDLQRESSYHFFRAAELAVLTDSHWKTWLAQHGIELATFQALPALGHSPHFSCFTPPD